MTHSVLSTSENTENVSPNELNSLLLTDAYKFFIFLKIIV